MTTTNRMTRFAILTALPLLAAACAAEPNQVASLPQPLSAAEATGPNPGKGISWFPGQVNTDGSGMLANGLIYDPVN